MYVNKTISAYIWVSFPRTGISAILGKVNAQCSKTKRGSLVFSTVPGNLGFGHHKNVAVNYIALVKLVHDNP